MKKLKYEIKYQANLSDMEKKEKFDLEKFTIDLEKKVKKIISFDLQIILTDPDNYLRGGIEDLIIRLTK